jgi:ubiquinone/menaquinone biosynthesis C-methylase UbiE
MRLHAAWHLLYDRFAWIFDFTTYCVSRGTWKAWGRVSLGYLTRRRVLELAHGPGHLLIALRQSGHQPVGIDRSAQMGWQAARRLRRAGLTVPLVRCEAEALPFRSGSFDEVVSTFPTDAIFAPQTLREVARVTSERARLVVVAGAQRKGLRPDPHFLAWLAGMIGQGTVDPGGSASAFRRAGMQPRIECRSIGRSTVMLVIAEKCSHETATAAAPAIEPAHDRTSRRQPNRGEEWVPIEVGHRA